MLLPLLTSTKYRVFPAVTLFIVIANFIIFLVTRENISAAAVQWGFTPSQYAESFVPFWPRTGRAETFLTYAFLHGGWMHLIGNMWMLAVFGSALEITVGRFRFAAFYLGFAVAAVIVHAMLAGGPPRPCVGASGAISGVLGCYLAMEPRSRVLSVFFLLVILLFVEIPTAFYVVVWLIIQIDGVQTHLLGGPGCCNIAWWAHLGGFAAGAALGMLISAVRKRKKDGPIVFDADLQ